VNTLNPFSVDGADAIREILISQIVPLEASSSYNVFRERAHVVVSSLTPALIWMRDVKGIDLTIEVIELSIELRWIWALAIDKVLILRDPQTEVESELDVSAEFPNELALTMRSYLDEVPGADTSLPFSEQGCQPAIQHLFVELPHLAGMIDRLVLRMPFLDRNSHDQDAPKS